MIIINTNSVAGLWGSFAAGMLNIPTIIIAHNEIFILSKDGSKYIFNHKDHDLPMNFFYNLSPDTNFTQDFLDQIGNFTQRIFVPTQDKSIFININDTEQKLRIHRENNEISSIINGEVFNVNHYININTEASHQLHKEYNITSQSFLDILQEITNLLGKIYNENSEFHNVASLPHSTTTGLKLFQY